MQHIYALPSQMPAGNFLLQITAKRYIFTIANTGKWITYTFDPVYKPLLYIWELFLVIKPDFTNSDLVNFTESSFAKKI